MAGRTGRGTDRRRDRRTGNSCWSGCFWQLRIVVASCTSVCNRMPRKPRFDVCNVSIASSGRTTCPWVRGRSRAVCLNPRPYHEKTRPATRRRFRYVPPSGSQRIASLMAPLSLGRHDVLLSRFRRPKCSGFCGAPGGMRRPNQGRANASEAAVGSGVA